MKRLQDKNILITGASSGIGKECAFRCYEEGAKVHLLGRNERSLKEIYAHLNDNNNSIGVLDLKDFERYQSVIENIVTKQGKIDGFIHSAGYQITLPISAMDHQMYLDIFAVNTISAFEFIRLLSKKNYGNLSGMSIVLIASVMSIIANPALTAYCASKAALVGGARSLALELATKNIRVNCVSPGYLKDTKMMTELSNVLNYKEMDNLKKGYPLGLGSVKDISALCIFLLSDESKWITGQNIIIDGGYSI
ncbi:MAG: SDR family oxidoreductase [Candidatus Cloacimonas acidaminovorans]|jgi:NAD(P)-dependent dehydrogenase (short-subunit alcohol dehydrogenase family)|nr:SDR family oxidoreductase [Candidatus Cloacimonas acidaminovorans]